MAGHAPVPDAETAEYWEAAAAGRLLFKRCRACGRPFSYPRSACPRCWSIDVEWVEAEGRAAVYSFTVIHQNDLAPFRDRIPYVVAVVELDEGVRMTTNVVGCDPSDMRCGMPVRVAFREETDGTATVTVPVFEPA